MDSSQRSALTRFAMTSVADSRFSEFQGLRNAAYQQVIGGIIERHEHKDSEAIKLQATQAIEAKFGNPADGNMIYESLANAIAAEAAKPKEQKLRG